MLLRKRRPWRRWDKYSDERIACRRAEACVSRCGLRVRKEPNRFAGGTPLIILLGSFEFAAGVGPAAIDQQGAIRNHGRHLGVAKLEQMTPKRAVFGLFKGTVAPVKVAAHQRNSKPGIVGCRIKGGQSSLSGSGNTDPKGIHRRARN